MSDATPESNPAVLSARDYATLTEKLLADVEAQVDRWLQDDVIDLDTRRSGGLLEIKFPNRSQMILNTQPPLQEVWLAARAGGFHFRFDGKAWRDTRSQETLHAILDRCASAQAGMPLTFKGR